MGTIPVSRRASRDHLLTERYRPRQGKRLRPHRGHERRWRTFWRESNLRGRFPGSGCGPMYRRRPLSRPILPCVRSASSRRCTAPTTGIRTIRSTSAARVAAPYIQTTNIRKTWSSPAASTPGRISHYTAASRGRHTDTRPSTPAFPGMPASTGAGTRRTRPKTWRWPTR